MDHQVDYLKHPSEHKTRVEQSDSKFDNKEEKRVIPGSETKTAKANDELKSGLARDSHRTTDVRVLGPTLTKINKTETVKILNKQECSGRDITRDLQILNKYVK